MWNDMAKTIDYEHKFESFRSQTLFNKLHAERQAFIRKIAFEHRLSFQEFRQIAEIARDFEMWGQGDLPGWWASQNAESGLTGVALKKHLLQQLQRFVADLKNKPKVYPENGLPKPSARKIYHLNIEKSDKKIYGMCPVASEQTVCCNLHTIDAVENCAFGCSYCTIQTFYSDTFTFDADFAEKLKKIDLEPKRFYHFGTGQSSDSLIWGNRNGNLDALCRFAADNPNVLLEFKTKSSNIRYFLENEIPRNIVCSWSLNTPTIIENEEHFTATYDQRFAAAKRLAEHGIRVSFHFHPMVYYQGWEQDYPATAARVLNEFDSKDVLFISFGSITMIKPAIKKIRKLGQPTKILQMEMAPDPHGKLTYPDDLKVTMFKTMYDAFLPWHRQVFFYLCMEKASIWERSLRYVYKTNDHFERDFGLNVMRKLP